VYGPAYNYRNLLLDEVLNIFLVPRYKNNIFRELGNGQMMFAEFLIFCELFMFWGFIPKELFPYFPYVDIGWYTAKSIVCLDFSGFRFLWPHKMPLRKIHPAMDYFLEEIRLCWIYQSVLKAT